MAIPFFKEMRIGGYLIKQKLLGRKRYPLVLMLEPLFRCNLACVGCGKIDYPDAILNRRMTAQECWDAADECGAPMVAIPGGEPLIHKDIGEIVRGLVARKKCVSLCTNALLREKKLDVLALGKGKNCIFMHSGLFLHFLAGNPSYECTPWGMPARNIFGWQKPCYLLGEGYTKTFKELMETTDWETYGTGKYEKCANCMAHCGYEPTAADAAFANPFKALWVALRGVRTSGPMAPEISLENQRPAQYIFSAEVQKRLSEIRRDEALAAQQKTSTAA